MTELSPNHALLAGEVFGALSLHFDEIGMETDELGNYTGRTLITRPSGVWGVRVEPVDVTDYKEQEVP